MWARYLGWALVGGAIGGCSKSEPDVPPGAAVPIPRGAAQGLGSIAGTIRVDGDLPAPLTLRTVPSVERQCGSTVEDPSLQVREGALENAVVFLADGADLPPVSSPPRAPTIDQRRCLYVPAILAAHAGGELVIRNSDALMHNVRAEGRGTLFNVAMPVTGMRLTKPLPSAPGEIDLRCDVHTWMRAVIRTFDHAYFTQTDGGGRFILERIPPGKHTLAVWHPRFKEQRATVEVSPGETADHGFVWRAGDRIPR